VLLSWTAFAFALPRLPVLIAASLGNWLHTVARHLALRIQAQGAKRRARESEVVEVPAPAVHDPAWQELRPELDRLPTRYRTPIVLCHLEGKSNEEAAQELGCPVGTVKCRLSRARDLLLGPPALFIVVRHLTSRWPPTAKRSRGTLF